MYRSNRGKFFRSPSGRPTGWVRNRRTGVLVVAMIASLAAGGPFGCGRGARNAADPEAYGGPAIKNVVIFLVDTLRADHLGCYGYKRATSPNLDAFAKQAVLFERAFSVSPWTRTSVASLFTSLHPASHACQDKDDSASDALLMLAEVFQENGYRTAGFSTNISISEKFNFQQGFERLTYYERKPWFEAHPGRTDPGYVPIEGMMPDVLSWLTAVGDVPFFLYVHSTDPHYKYVPPNEFSAWGRKNSYDRYDGEIRYVDHYFGRFIEHLRSLGQLDKTLIVFTADHGEEWREHGRNGHGHSLYNELLEVPLIMRHPAFGPRRRSEVVRLIDVFPTLVSLCRLDCETDPLQGRSLAALLAGKPDPRPDQHFVFSEIMYPSKIEALAYQSAGWKIIWTLRDKFGKRNVREIYRIRDDGREQFNLGLVEQNRMKTLASELADIRKECVALQVKTVKAKLDPETYETLKALGYVE